MGEYCLRGGKFVAAKLGEDLTIKQFPHTFAVVNGKGVPVCIPHEGCTLELIDVDPELERHSVLNVLRPGQSVRYRIEDAGQQRERDVITLKTGMAVALKDLGKSTFQITGEQGS